MALMYFLLVIGDGVFAYFMPNIFWNITWDDLVTIVSGRDTSVNILNKLTELASRLGLTRTDLKTWAIERIFICIGIALAIFILLTVIRILIKKQRQK